VPSLPLWQLAGWKCARAELLDLVVGVFDVVRRALVMRAAVLAQRVRVFPDCSMARFVVSLMRLWSMRLVSDREEEKNKSCTLVNIMA
jgi:hypothetical protein